MIKDCIEIFQFKADLKKIKLISVIENSLPLEVRLDDNRTQ